MKTGKFEKKIRGLGQIEILSGTVNALNQLLVDKEITNEAELQKYFQKWLQKHKSKNSFDKMSLEDVENLEAKHTAFMGHGPHNLSILKKKKK